MIFIVAVTLGLSLVANVAYIYTMLGLSAWIAFGHLVTLDDDMPGEWSNPEGDKKLWHSSLVILAIKFAVLMALFIAVFTFPVLKTIGA